jgi:DNA-binding transcriptional regulator YdaS (Cro superfamily)
MKKPSISVISTSVAGILNILGGPSAVARLFDGEVTQQAVSQWGTRNVIPPARAAKLAAALRRKGYDTRVSDLVPSLAEAA